MYAPNLPEPWMIAELENLRRIRESDGERPRLELPLPPPPPPPAPRESDERAPRTVIVIEL